MLVLEKESELYSQNLSIIAKSIQKSKRCIIVTGAGISVAAGIPDFRSENGLYNLVKQRYPDIVVKGKDLFDASLFREKKTTRLFYTFIAMLKELTDKAEITKTHKFIKSLQDTNQLLRCYTQNIDSLETRAGMSTLNDGKLVQLHGDIDHVMCTFCKSVTKMNQDIVNVFHTGTSKYCETCVETEKMREAQGKRPSTIGVIRPNIVLYNENHSTGDSIGDILGSDMKRKPDLLIIMGTSLKVVGVRRMIKEMAERVHSLKSGKVIFVNKTPPSVSDWKGYFDYSMVDESDSFVTCIQEEIIKLETINIKRAIKIESTINPKNVYPVTKSRNPIEAIQVVIKSPTHNSSPSLSDQTNLLKKKEKIKIEKNTSPKKAQPVLNFKIGKQTKVKVGSKVLINQTESQNESVV